MKKLVLVSGTMGVGKSSTCRHLYKMAERTAWLDGDWCWLMNPWNPCDENRKMVMDNITAILGSYLANSTIDNIVFSWVLHKKEIIDELLGRLCSMEFELFAYALSCSPQSLRERMREDGRDADSIEPSVDRLPLYNLIGWEVIDTTRLSSKATAELIAKSSGLLAK